MSKIKKYLLTGGVIILLLSANSAFAVVNQCGDINGDEQISIFDITFLISYLYLGGPPPAIPALADVNGTGDLNIFDITYLVGYLYLGGPPLACQEHIHSEIQSGCIGYEQSRDDSNYVYFEVLGNDLHIHNINAWYNCGLNYVVDYYIVGSNITAVESDTGEPADCICYFNLESILYDLEDGGYVVTLIGIYGDTLGIGTIIVEEGFGLIGYQDSGCLEKGKGEFSTGSIVYTYSDNILTMNHFDAFFNCGALFLIEFEQASDTLRLYELNISRENVWCMCYFNISVFVIGLAPGDYVAEVYEQQYDWDEIQLVDRQELLLE